MSARSLDSTDRQLLQALQCGLSTVERPFLRLAEQLELTEAEVLERTRRLLKLGIIRRIGPMLDVRACGGVSVLAALKAPRSKASRVGRSLSRFAEVSHNYERRPLRPRGAETYNIWFTLSAPSERALRALLQKMENATGLPVAVFPARRTFKLAVRFPLDNHIEDPDRTNRQRSDKGLKPLAFPPLRHLGPRSARVSNPALTAEQRRVLRAIQDGIPITARPFADVARALRMTEAQVLGLVRSLSRRGAIRRIAASLAHRRLGVRGNLLCAWRVPSRRVNAIGRAMASFPEVSHCYERETPPDWPWNVFTMIHGRTVADALRTVQLIREGTGLADYVVLQSTRELKKTWPRV